MKNALKIGKPYIETKSNTSARLCADLFMNDEKVYTLWYEVDKKWKSYLCTERVDAFAVNLLLYAMEHGLNLECEQVMSERLYYQLTEYLIPCISKNILKYSSIEILADVDATPLSNAKGVGASLSGGVDSFYTLHRHMNRKEEGYNITHLTFFNAGASGEYGGEEARRRYHARIDWIKDVADKLHLDLVCVDTNANEFLMQKHLATHSFRTLAIPLALQKLFAIYYFSSGDPFKKFDFSEQDPAPYDLLNVQCLATENLTFYSSGGEATRMEKLQDISDWELPQNKLNVCISEDVNCGRCEKCERTMTGLYALQQLDKYRSVFDLDYFRAHKATYMIDAVAKRKQLDREEIYKALQARGEFTPLYYIIGNMKLLYYILRERCSKVPALRNIYHRIK